MVSHSSGKMHFGTSSRWRFKRFIGLLGAVALISSFITPTYAAQSQRAFSAPTSLLSWGVNDNGQLGYVTPTTGCNLPCQASPAFVPPITGFAAITGGEHHTLGLRSDGTVWTWGYNGYGELGNGQEQPASIYTPQQVIGLTDVQAVAGGVKHSIALKHDGTVWTWGENSYGQLGAPSHNHCGGEPCSLTPVQVLGPGGVGYLQNIVAVAAGSVHSVALAQDGTVWTWGANNYGELGNNTYRDSATPIQVRGPHGVGVLSGVIAIASSSEADHTLALHADGTVSAWGNDNFDQLAVYCIGGPICTIPYPTTVNGLRNVKAVAAGGEDSLALKENGTVWGWGHNDIGQLGFQFLGSNPCYCTPHPTLATGLTGVTAIAASYQHSLALKGNGTLWAAGSNAHGELGLGQPDLNIHPVFGRVLGLDNVTSIGVTGIATSMALAKSSLVHAAAISPPTLLFSNQPLDTTSPPQNVTITNLGTTALVVSGASFLDTGRAAGCIANPTLICGSLPWEFSVQGSPFPLSIPPNGSAELGIVFTPASVLSRAAPSFDSAYMVLATNAPKSTLAVDISGQIGP